MKSLKCYVTPNIETKDSRDDNRILITSLSQTMLEGGFGLMQSLSYCLA